MHLSDWTPISDAFVCPHHGAISVAPDDQRIGMQVCPLCLEEAEQTRPGLEYDVPSAPHSPLHFRQHEERAL